MIDIEKPQTFGIWPPYEAFYIEAMLFSTEAALKSVEIVGGFLENKGHAAAYRNEDILDALQNILTHAGMLSRYFWPVKNNDAKKSEGHEQRARHLRSAFEMAENSPLRNRELRNHIEHFDENLDAALAKPIAGNIIPAYIGPSNRPTAPTHFFRAYYYDTGIFEILGRTYELQPVIDELCNVHERLVQAVQNGHRL